MANTRKNRIGLAVSDELLEKLNREAKEMSVPLATYCTFILAQQISIKEKMINQVSDGIVMSNSKNIHE